MTLIDPEVVFEQSNTKGFHAKYFEFAHLYLSSSKTLYSHST